AAALPRPVEPREAARVRGLAEAAGTLERLLREAVETARRFEAPLRARVDAGGLRTGELGAQLRQLGEREAEFRREAGEAQHRLSSIGIEGARLEAEREEVVGRLPEETAPAELAADDEEQLRTKLDRGERRREELGQVNPLAAQEYEAERERLDELTAQREDLERSVAELDELCSELTETVERSFEETFASVQEHFCNVAATLFPGGEGRLRLADGEEGSESGVEVELRLAGKRITRLSLLSGGEKALGALSFLFALFLARPCPFYVLDEVEAALDDTNIGRFVELLRRYASEAQFIVVTHQKRTMDAADILYGVTMADDGVSQIVSRRLRPAMEAVPA
ncbi:MAG: AAA family ATPase, partial [Gaiellales bacterium]